MRKKGTAAMAVTIGLTMLLRCLEAMVTATLLAVPMAMAMAMPAAVVGCNEVVVEEVVVAVTEGPLRPPRPPTRFFSSRPRDSLGPCS